MSDLEEIKRALEEMARDQRVPCAEALALAERMGVDPKRVGEAANALRIKITGCQLGCF